MTPNTIWLNQRNCLLFFLTPSIMKVCFCCHSAQNSHLDLQNMNINYGRIHLLPFLDNVHMIRSPHQSKSHWKTMPQRHACINCRNCPEDGTPYWQATPPSGWFCLMRELSLKIMLLVLNWWEGWGDILKHIGIYCICVYSYLLKTYVDCPEDGATILALVMVTRLVVLYCL